MNTVYAMYEYCTVLVHCVHCVQCAQNSRLRPWELSFECRVDVSAVNVFSIQVRPTRHSNVNRSTRRAIYAIDIDNSRKTPSGAAIDISGMEEQIDPDLAQRLGELEDEFLQVLQQFQEVKQMEQTPDRDAETLKLMRRLGELAQIAKASPIPDLQELQTLSPLTGTPGPSLDQQQPNVAAAGNASQPGQIAVPESPGGRTPRHSRSNTPGSQLKNLIAAAEQIIEQHRPELDAAAQLLEDRSPPSTPTAAVAADTESGMQPTLETSTADQLLLPPFASAFGGEGEGTLQQLPALELDGEPGDASLLLAQEELLQFGEPDADGELTLQPDEQAALDEQLALSTRSLDPLNQAALELIAMVLPSEHFDAFLQVNPVLPTTITE